MNKKEESIVRESISKYCETSKNYYSLSAYGMKSAFEELTGIYIPECKFVELMEQCGFTPIRKKNGIRFKVFVKPCREVNKYFWGWGGCPCRYEKKTT